MIGVRLGTDPNTHKSKGFAFVEYSTPDLASSAVRNLQGYQLNGRGLRVDWAEPNKAGITQKPRPMGGPPPPAPPGPGVGGGLQGLPPGVQLPPQVNAQDAISQTLAAIPPNQLLDIMGQIKVCLYHFSLQ